LGSPRHLTRSCFHLRDYRLISPDRSLVICYDPELILSRSRLFRAPEPHLLAHRLSARASPAWVSGPLRDITRAQPPNSRRLPSPRFVPSSGFLSLSTSSSAHRLAGLFHPAATFRVLPVQGSSLPAQPPFLFGRSFPQAVCFPDVLTDFRRLPHTSDLGFEAFIRARQRSLQHSYSPHCTPLPSSGSSPPGTHFTRSNAVYLRAPLTTFLSLRLRLRDRASSSSSACLPREAWRRVSASPACPSFRAFLQPSVHAIPSRRPLPCDDPVRDLRLTTRLPSRSAVLPEHAK
jgi:hypothetical protein